MLSLRRQIVATDDYELIKSKIMFMADFFLNSPHNGAMNYFDSATGNGILSVYYQIGGDLQKLRGAG